MAYILDQKVQVKCPHGGTGTIIPTQQTAKIDGSLLLTEDATAVIVGCPLSASSPPTPCVEGVFQGGVEAKIGGKKLVTSETLMVCKNPSGVAQGPATFSGFQTSGKVD